VKMTNRWNRVIYRFWAPVYDATVGRMFLPGRRQAMQVLDLVAGERVLLVGVGTGADLPLLPEGVEAVGVDLSLEMLARARSRQLLPGRAVCLIQGDAQAPLVEAGVFDAVVLNLVLSVIPDGSACLRSALAALKPGGRAVVFDKFRPDGRKASALRRFLNFFSTIMGTDITRRFGDLLGDLPWEVVRDEDSILRGAYRVILLCEPDSSPAVKLHLDRVEDQIASPLN
jgi:phosphatidylethanolamine/phosphatidyl-N-methylethanolamine N-methyltransferase